MVQEEYNNTKCYFWAEFTKFLACIPFLMIIGFVITYYVGPSRTGYIKSYPWKRIYNHLVITRQLNFG